MSVHSSGVVFGGFPAAAEVSFPKKSKCGVCHEEGGTVIWPTSNSTTVHSQCYDLIKRIANRVAEIISSVPISEDSLLRPNEIHVRVVRAVEQVFYPKTIFSYLSENGVEALLKLFNTVGMDAAKDAVRMGVVTDSSKRSGSPENEMIPKGTEN